MSGERMKLWAVLEPAAPDSLRREVEAAEAAGLEGVWVPQLWSPPFPAMAAIAQMSRSLRIGSGVALAFTRSPLETALDALDVDLLSGGRTVLGLGTSIRAVTEGFHGSTYGKPIAHLREVVRIVRDVIEKGHTGELGAYEGEYHKVDLRGFRVRPPVRPSIPIWLPALFASSIRLAAEVGDGLIGHPVWSREFVTGEMAKTLDEALARRGRSRDRFHVNLWIYTAIADDAQRAVDEARGTVAFYASVAQYEKYFASHGFGDAARAVAAAAARGDAAGMAAAVPDEMVRRFAAVGTADEVRERVAAMARHADSVTLVPPGTGGSLPPARVAEYRRAIADTFFAR